MCTAQAQPYAVAATQFKLGKLNFRFEVVKKLHSSQKNVAEIFGECST